MANGNQDSTLVSDEELFEIEENGDEEEQDQQVSDDELFATEESEPQQEQITGEQVDDESLFDTSEPIQPEDEEEEQEPPFELGDSKVANIVESAATFFVPEEDPEGAPDAFDFEAAGDVWTRGAKKAIDALSNIPEFISDNFQRNAIEWNRQYLEKLESGDLTEAQEKRFREAIEGTRNQAEVVAKVGNNTAKKMRNYSASIKANPSKIKEANDIWDWFEPNRLWQTIGEQAPLTGAIMATFAVNRFAGAALMFGVEGGEVNHSINKMKERGVEVDPTVQHVAANSVGILNMAMERLGIEKMIGASRATGFKRKALGILTGALTEAPTEAGQEASQAIGAELANELKNFSDLSDKRIEELIPDNIGERMLKGFYGGLVIGTGMSMATATLGSFSKKTPDDARVMRFEKDDEGILQPVFRIEKPGHDMELEEVGLSEIEQMDDIHTPNYRMDRLIRQGRDAGLIEDDQQADVLRTLIAARSAKENITAEEWIHENIDSIISGEKIDKNDLMQAVNQSIEDLGIEPEVSIGDAPTDDPLKIGLLDSEGRLYIGKKGQGYEEVAADFQLPMNRVSLGFVNQTGNFIGKEEATNYLRQNTSVTSENVLKELDNEKRMTDPETLVPLNERSLIGGESDSALKQRLLEAGILERSINLREWFENSKITQPDGKPMIVYHGTRGDFNVFDHSQAKARTDAGFYGEGFYLSDSPRMASFFADASYGDAAANIMPVYLKMTNPFEITEDTSVKDLVEELDLREITIERFREGGISIDAVSDEQLIENLDAEEMTGDGLIDFITNLIGSQSFRDILIDNGYDGVIAPSTDAVTPNAKEYVVFESEQIKSATGNNGDFGPSPNILLQTGFRGRGENSGLPSEGDGLYIADSPELAGLFGVVDEVEYKTPEKQIEVDYLPLLHFDLDTLEEPIREGDSEWIKINKEATQRLKEEEDVNSLSDIMSASDSFMMRNVARRKIVEDIGDKVGEITRERGYDAIRVPDSIGSNLSLVPEHIPEGESGWTVLLDESLVEGGFQEYYQRDISGEVTEVKGAVDFSEGKAIIKAFESADFTTMLHELAHVFRRSLDESELQEILDTMQAKTERGWTREAEEEFADRFMEWAEGGQVDNFRLRSAFRTFRKWIIDLVGNLASRDDLTLSEEQEEFFNNMFDEIQNDANQIENPSRRFGFLGEWAHRLWERLDVEARFREVGLPEVGFHMKNFFSIQEVYTQEGFDVEERIARLLGGDQEKQIEAILAAESPTRLEELRKEGRDDIVKAAENLRAYFDRSKAEYEARGAENVDFKRRILSVIDSKIKAAEEIGDVEKATNLRNKFQEIQENFEFVSIPFNHWFQSQAENNMDNAIQLLDLLATKFARDNIRIESLIEDEVIDPEDITTRSILESYSTNKAKDFALLNIRQAALQEGGMIPIQEGQDYRTGYHRAPSGAILFEGYQVRDVINSWISTQLTKNDELGAWKRFFNKVKMAAFWNPLFLPMYDVLQSTMAGAVQFTRPIRTARLIKNALGDVMNRTDEYYLAGENGISSKPYASPYHEIGRQFDRASRARMPSHLPTSLKTLESIKNYGMEALHTMLRDFGDLQGMDWIKTLGGTTIPLRALYQTSWDTAWFLDRTVRQVTYRHFKEEGFNDREAAQKAAETHADYASIPPNTRRALNSIFFTPTFKIAMGKWFADSLRSIGNVLQGNATLSQKELASVAIRTTGILVAYDMMMLALDFERDEFGRRYIRPADTDKGTKELVVTWTGPHNLFLKYAQRIENTATDPAVTNMAKRVLEQHSWELHPIYRIGASVVNNSTPGGEKIYNSLDDDSTKLAKMSTYAVNSAVALFRQISEEDEFGKKGGEVFAREYGQMWEVITKPFIFKYTRQPKEVRINSQIQMMRSIADEEIGASQMARDILRSDKDTEEMIEEFKEGLEERSENFSKRMQGIINKLEEEQYDRTNNPPVNRDLYPEDNSPDSNSGQAVPDSVLFDE